MAAAEITEPFPSHELLRRPRRQQQVFGRQLAVDPHALRVGPRRQDVDDVERGVAERAVTLGRRGPAVLSEGPGRQVVERGQAGARPLTFSA